MTKAKRAGSPTKTRQSKKGVWDIPNLRSRVQELIVKELMLTKKDGEGRIVATISAEFEEQLTASKLRFTLTALRAKLDELIWTAAVKKDFRASFGKPWMMDHFREVHKHITDAMVRRQERRYKGYTKSRSIAAFRAGMGRVDTSGLPKSYEGFRFPENSYSLPLVLSKEPSGMVPLINGALVGIKYPDIEANTPRRSFADARHHDADGIVLTNFLDIWTKRTAGYRAVYRAAVSGIQINPDRFEDKEYAREVRAIMSGELDEMIYMTLAQRLEEIFDALHKLTHRKRNQGPEFPGPVWILLGLLEEEVIKALAYYEARYKTIKKQPELRVALQMATRKLKEAEEDEDWDEVDYWKEKQEKCAMRYSACIISNHTDVQYEWLSHRIRAWVVWRLESIIPNSKVIGQGRINAMCGPYTVKLTMPKDDNVRDSHLADLGDTYGADLQRSQLADLTVSLPPYSLNPRSVGREDSEKVRELDDGTPVFEPKTRYLAVASSCLDGEFLREEFKDTQKAVHPVQELVFNPQFKPGVTYIRWGTTGIYPDDFPIERLGRCKPNNANYAYPYPKTRYITSLLATDWHFGAADRRWIYIPEKGITMGVAEATIELMRYLGVLNPRDIRTHMFHSMDDLTNGDMWFRPGYRPDPNRMRLFQFERWQIEVHAQIRRAIETKDAATAEQLLDELGRISVLQMALHGEEFPFHQMEQIFEMHVNPNVDFYSAVLGSWVRSGCRITGVSKLTGQLIDTRDLGVANFATGNHRLRTLDQKELEGDHVARVLREKLKQLPEWQRYAKKDSGFLNRSVIAPRFGGMTYGWGLVQAPDGEPWSIRVHGSPAKQQGWSDILGAVVKSDLARGDDSYSLMKFPTVTFFGDKHFYDMVETERMRYIMCAAGVHTNHYGSDGGFPPNNTGTAFVSIPADGPKAGPILFRPIPHDFLRDFFAKKPKDRPEINWETFLPEPV